MVKFRIEKDSLGEIKVDSSKLWGAQTQRSIENFQIGIGKFHFQNIFIEALALQKKSCALANSEIFFIDSMEKTLPPPRVRVFSKLINRLLG